MRKGLAMNDARLLFVGREDGVVRSWVGRIRDAGCDVTAVGDGASALRHLDMLEPDAVLVDVRQDGGLDGYDVCRRMRDRTSAVLMLAGSGLGPFDEVVALAVGADHFVAAETPVEVIEARLRSCLRRSRELATALAVQGAAGNGSGPAVPSGGRPAARAATSGNGAGPGAAAAPAGRVAATAVLAPAPETERIVEGDLEIDLLAREVTAAGQLVALTRIEFDLLVTLAQQPRRVFTREQLMISVWDDPFDGSHVLDTHLSRLRVKVRAAGADRVAHAVRGVGYRLRA